MSISGRCGIDKEAVDFSQFEEYINDVNDNIYFHEALTGSVLKLEERNPFSDPCTEANQRSTELIPSSRVATNLSLTDSDCPNKVPQNSPEENIPTDHQVLISTFLQKYTSTLEKENCPVLNPHNLPDSPPDSGSEHPFCSSEEEPGSSRIGQSVHVTMMQSQAETLKHFITYGNTQPLKHLPDASLNFTPSHQNSPHQGPNSIAQAGTHTPTHQILALATSGLTQTALPAVSMQPPSPIVPPSRHLGSLYSSNDDFICEDLNSQGSKKRKLSDSPKSEISSLLNGMVHIKQEPSLTSEPCTTSVLGSDDQYSFDFGSAESSSMFLDATYQCIRFQPFQQNTWHTLCDKEMKDIPSPNYRVDADKGFNFSNADDAFVCQKKNHFQVTVHVQPMAEARYVRTSEGVKAIDSFFVHFYGVKMESPNQTIKVEQSQSDRSKKPFHPVLADLVPEQMLKTTVGRLHFSETTSNNMRKKGKPNPDQRYFFLVVALCAHVGDEAYTVVAHSSEKIIVRASNPGQFENDMELSWQKGHTPDSVYHAGRVGINTDRPEDSLAVHGNIKVTGHIIQPSDLRIKTNIYEIDTKEQLRNVSNMRIVNYRYLPEFARHAGFSEDEVHNTGVIAQEIKKILPDAVREAGDVYLPNGECIEKFLVVNKERIFMENVGAVKELCKVTDNLETRIDELEKINKKLSNLKRLNSMKSNSSASTNKSWNTVATSSLKKAYKHTRHIEQKHPLFLSNHFIQATIVALVIIMTFCLVTMATLYILEWQKRHGTPVFLATFVNKQLVTQSDFQVKSYSSTTPPYQKPSHSPIASNDKIDGKGIENSH